MSGLVTIDSSPTSAQRYQGQSIVAVDVIRATTTAVTAVDRGHRVFVAASLEHALALSETHDGALLAGELGGHMPYGFDLQNSPSLMSQLSDTRPIVLISSAGTQLLHAAAAAGHTYVACLRNMTATARSIAARGGDVAVIGAGTRGQFREEDQIGCAWISERLLDAGLTAANDETSALIERWHEVPVEAIEDSASAAYLLNSGQLADLEFVIDHVDDLDQAYIFVDDEVCQP